MQTTLQMMILRVRFRKTLRDALMPYILKIPIPRHVRFAGCRPHSVESRLHKKNGYVQVRDDFVLCDSIQRLKESTTPPISALTEILN